MVDEQYVPDDSDYIYSVPTDDALVVELWNGTNTSLILTRTFTNPSTSFQTYVITLTTAERNAVTNWRDLSVHLTVNNTDTAILRMDIINTPTPGPVTLYIRARGV